MSLDPHGLLAGVHPDLVEVATKAWAASPTFQVVYGLRTVAAEAQAVASGHSTTMHSRHLADANYGGKCCAFDFAALEAGAISWDTSLYPKIAGAIKDAALALNIPVEWGGDWSSFRDYGHIQLPWNKYP